MYPLTWSNSFIPAFVWCLPYVSSLRSSIFCDSQGRLCGYITNVNKSMWKWGGEVVWVVLGLGFFSCILEHKDIKVLNVLQTLVEFVVQINYLDYWLYIGAKPCLWWEMVKKILSSLTFDWIQLHDYCSSKMFTCGCTLYLRLCMSCRVYRIEIIEPVSDLLSNLEQYCVFGAVLVHRVRICWLSEEILRSTGCGWFHSWLLSRLAF